jgi:hypothetical protein
VLVRGVTCEDLNSWFALAAALLSASCFDSLNNFCAALALLLGLFFGVGIVVPLFLHYMQSITCAVSIFVDRAYDARML